LDCAVQQLDDEAAKSIADFVRARHADDGGIRGRSSESDLYYTVFGLDCLLALDGQAPIGKVQAYIDTFGEGERLDFVHLSCLVRCRSRLRRMMTDMETGQRILRRLENYRSVDGGYHPQARNTASATYACFLAFLGYESFEKPLPAPHELMTALRMHRGNDGSFRNEPDGETGGTPSTAAAVLMGHHLGEPCSPAAVDWLLARFQDHGGFKAGPEAPEADLLSTATALMALHQVGVPLEEIREPCVDFVASLWDEDGGFRGHRLDPMPDCEYTFYGLLALGILESGNSKA